MKVFALLCLLSPLAFSQTSAFATGKCGQGLVPDASKICIEPNYIEGCEVYKNADVCQTCSKNYESVNGRCNIDADIKTQALPGCLEISGGKCVNCANGFRRQDGKCLLGIKNCQKYKTDGSCSSCKIQFSLILNECKHNYLLGCKNEQNDHTCSSCYEPFKLNNYQCTIDHCTSYNDFGCTSCKCGFYLDDNKACKKMVDGCLKYTKGVCTKCIPHYKLKGGSCVIEGCLEYTQSQSCSKCSDLYDNTNGECHFKNCVEWHEDRCTICAQGYNGANGVCVKEDHKFVCQ